jgi:hypothetical protein
MIEIESACTSTLPPAPRPRVEDEIAPSFQMLRWPVVTLTFPARAALVAVSSASLPTIEKSEMFTLPA